MTTAPERHRTLAVELLDSWHVGTGRGEGQHLDALVDLDVDGFPHVPGRMLRGLLRDACECVEHWSDASADFGVKQLFGALARSDDAPGRQISEGGFVGITSARLSPPLRHALLQADGKRAGPNSRALRMTSFQTALDPATGTALPQSLRGIELAVPMMLEASLDLWPSSDELAAQAWSLLDKALPLVWAVGAHKTRGHGRARLAWQQPVLREMAQ